MIRSFFDQFKPPTTDREHKYRRMKYQFEPDFEMQIKIHQLKIPNPIASKWLNLCNFTNIKQKIDYLKQYDLGDHRDL